MKIIFKNQNFHNININNIKFIFQFILNSINKNII